MTMNQIPPVQCLTTFEAVARLRSVTRAAEELCVTVSAVSHRVRQLESLLGVKLFAKADFTPTTEGAAYLQHVRTALTALAQVPHPGRVRQPMVRVAVTPSFSREFLLPRLEEFRRAYPEIELALHVSIPFLDVTAEPADLEFRFGTGAYGDCEYLRLIDDEITPACSPNYLAECGPFEQFETALEFDRARLMRTLLEPWSTWFDHCGVSRAEPGGGAQFNDLGLVYDAAAVGFGVTLVRLKLGRRWLDSGRLVRLSSRTVPSPHHHYVCWKAGALERWECAAFLDWIKASFT